MADEKQLTELSAKVDALSEAVGKIGTEIGAAVANAIKPLVDSHEAIVNAQKVKDEAEKAELITKVVKANMLDEDVAKETPLNTLRALAKQVDPSDKKAAPLNGAFKPAADGDKKFKLPKAEA